MTELSVDFRLALKEFGPLGPGESAPEHVISEFRGRLPDSLLDFWAAHGFGLWLDGYFQFCNPQRYRPIIEMVLGNDPDFKPYRSHVVGFSAFGGLLVWNEDYRIMDVDILYHRISCGEYFERIDTTDDIAIGVVIGKLPRRRKARRRKNMVPEFMSRRRSRACAPEANRASCGQQQVDSATK